MKKLLMIASASVLGLGAAACDSSQENAVEDAAEQQAEIVEEQADVAEDAGQITDEQADAMVEQAEAQADAAEEQAEAAAGGDAGDPVE